MTTPHQTSPTSTSGRRVAAATEPSTTPVARQSGWLRTLVRSTAVLCWLLAWLAGTAAATTSIVSVDVPAVSLDVPPWVASWGGALVGVLYALAVAHRLAVRTVLWTGLTAIGLAAALISERAWALAGVSVLTAVVSGVAAVLLTRPASGLIGTVREYLVALTIAVAGAVAVAGIDAPILLDRYTLTVFGLALALAIGAVWQLGAGLHGLGRRGFVLIVGAAVLLTGLLAYSQLLRTYGSPALVERVDESVRWLSTNLHGVPRPVEALLGFPALVWGIGTRAYRRQGWWMCAFGVLGTALLAASLAPQRLDPGYAGLSALYSAAIGLVVGLLVSRVDLLVSARFAPGRSGRRGSGRRADRGDEMPRVRPEPGRTRPLR